AEHIQSQRLPLAATKYGDTPIRQNDLDTQHIADCKPILEGMGAAGILGNISTNSRGILAGWVRCEVQSILPSRTGNSQIRHTHLDMSKHILRLDRQNAIHACQYQADATEIWRSSAGKSRAGTARRSRHAVLASQADNLLH